jgi:hypothetical protein
MEESKMRKEYDFSKAGPNPYFKKQAEETGIAYQNLINLYLSDCAVNGKSINIAWK